jgi:hypothetical protein
MRNHGRFLTYLLDCCVAVDLDLVTCASEEKERQGLNRALEYAVKEKVPISAIAGMRTVGNWMIDLAHNPKLLQEAILKAARKERPQAPEQDPTVDLSVTLLLGNLARDRWVLLGEARFSVMGSTQTRTMVVCLVFGGLRFAELQRMLWESMTISPDKIEFVLKVKNKARLQKVVFHRLANSTICPFDALIEFRALTMQLRNITPGKALSGNLWTNTHGRALSRTQISSVIGDVLQSFGVSRNKPYRIKKLVADALVRSDVNHVDVAHFFRHSPQTYMAEKRYTNNDRGKAASFKLDEILKASSKEAV